MVNTWNGEEYTVPVERKLVQEPMCMVALRLELRWFEEERNCPVEVIRVPDATAMLRVSAFVRELEVYSGAAIVTESVAVMRDEGVRPGYVILEGGAGEPDVEAAD